ncbi:hypothetical protein NJC08_27680, partial [Pseudomonas fluorescens]|nr:hypothetical protein [Pseudomonas fluorescens]
ATKYLEVEIFDGNSSTGKRVEADGNGIWTVELTGLTRTKHVFKAKALYGSGTESGEWAVTVLVDLIDLVEDFKSYPEGGKISESVELLEGRHTEARVFITMGLSDNNCTVTPEPSLKAELYGQGSEDYFGYGLTLKEGSATSAKIIGHV